MGSIAVLTDSCADLSPQVAEENGIFVIPLSVVYPEKVYADGVDITAEDVYRRMPEEVPTTTLPSGKIIEDTFRKIRDKGYKYVIALIFSGGISGTYNMVRMLGEEAEGLEVRVFDTKTASLGLGMIAAGQCGIYAKAALSWRCRKLSVL